MTGEVKVGWGVWVSGNGHGPIMRVSLMLNECQSALMACMFAYSLLLRGKLLASSPFFDSLLVNAMVVGLKDKLDCWVKCIDYMYPVDWNRLTQCSKGHCVYVASFGPPRSATYTLRAYVPAPVPGDVPEPANSLQWCTRGVGG